MKFSSKDDEKKLHFWSPNLLYRMDICQADISRSCGLFLENIQIPSAHGGDIMAMLPPCGLTQQHQNPVGL